MSEKQDVRVCLFNSNFHFAVKTAAKIKEMLGEFELTEYDGSATFEYLYSQVIERSCFSDQRVHHIKDWPKHRGTKQTMMKHLKALIERTPEDCFIILDNLPNQSESFIKWVNGLAFGKVFEDAKTLSFQEASRFVTEELEKRDKSMQRVDADAFVGAIALESSKDIPVDRIHVVIDKLCHYIGNRKIVKAADVLAISVDSTEFVTWTLFNYLDARDYCGTIAMLHKAVECDKTATDAVNSLLYFMNWRYKLILMLKDGVERGWETGKIKYELSQIHRMQRSGSFRHSKMDLTKNKTNDGFRSLYSEAMVSNNLNGSYGRAPSVRMYKRGELFHILEAVQASLEKVRSISGRSDAEVITTIDSIFMMICGISDYRILSGLRRTHYV